MNQILALNVTGMHGNAWELCMYASAGHTFEDDTIEW